MYFNYILSTVITFYPTPFLCVTLYKVCSYYWYCCCCYSSNYFVITCAY